MVDSRARIEQLLVAMLADDRYLAKDDAGRKYFGLSPASEYQTASNQTEKPALSDSDVTAQVLHAASEDVVNMARLQRAVGNADTVFTPRLPSFGLSSQNSGDVDRARQDTTSDCVDWDFDPDCDSYGHPECCRETVTVTDAKHNRWFLPSHSAPVPWDWSSDNGKPTHPDDTGEVVVESCSPTECFRYWNKTVDSSSSGITVTDPVFANFKMAAEGYASGYQHTGWHDILYIKCFETYYFLNSDPNYWHVFQYRLKEDCTCEKRTVEPPRTCKAPGSYSALDRNKIAYWDQHRWGSP